MSTLRELFDDITIYIHNGDFAKIHAPNFCFDFLAVTYDQPGEFVGV